MLRLNILLPLFLPMCYLHCDGFNSKFMRFLGFSNNLILHAQGVYFWEFKKSIKTKIISYF